MVFSKQHTHTHTHMLLLAVLAVMQLAESMQLDRLLNQDLAANVKGQQYLAQDLNLPLQAVVPSCIPRLIHNLKTPQP